MAETPKVWCFFFSLQIAKVHSLVIRVQILSQLSSGDTATSIGTLKSLKNRLFEVIQYVFVILTF